MASPLTYKRYFEGQLLYHGKAAYVDSLSIINLDLLARYDDKSLIKKIRVEW
jgi:hypothetical protein